MNIRGFLPTSLNEWPGKVSAVIWTAGCNFRCPFCQNRELVLTPEKLARFDQVKILADLKERRDWLDAVVVSGGEPTLQKDLANFLQSCRKIGLLTMIETNASHPKILVALFQAKLLDRISIDIKGDFDHYPKFTNSAINSTLIQRSIKAALKAGVEMEFRTTVVPTLHTKTNLIKLAKQLKAMTIQQCNNVTMKQWNWFLQQFIPQNCLDPKFEKIKPYSEKQLQTILAAARRHFPSAKLRGI